MTEIRYTGVLFTEISDSAYLLVQDNGITGRITKANLLKGLGIGVEEMADWKLVTSDYQASSGDKLLIDATTADVTISLGAAFTQGKEISLILFSTVNKVLLPDIKKVLGEVNQEAELKVRNKIINLVYINSDIGWIQTPELLSDGAGQEFNYVSGGDENGLFYWYGTNFGTQAWTNPYTANRFQVLVTGSSGLSGTVAQFFNRDTGGEYLYINGNSGNRARIEVYLPKKFKLNKFVFKTSSDGTFSKDFNIKAWNNPDTYAEAVTLASFTNQAGLLPSNFYPFDIPNTQFYDNYCFEHIQASNNDGYLRLAEIEFYGASLL